MEEMEIASMLFAFKGLESVKTLQDSLRDSGIEDDLDTSTLDSRESAIYARHVLEYVRRLDTHSLPNPFDIPDDHFTLCFNLNKSLFQDFLLRLCMASFFIRESDTHHIPLDLRVLATLTYLVHGHFEHVQSLEAFKPYTKLMLLRCVPQVCQSIVNFLAPTYIKFPSTCEDVRSNKNAFQCAYGVPGVVGVLDSFRVPLSKIPPAQQKMYMRKDIGPAVTVQVICNEHMRFLDVNPRFPAGTSDVYIWKRSHIRSIMQNLYQKDGSTWLVADRGYHLEDVVINPYRNARSTERKVFNNALGKLHSVMDRAVVILKTRFSCLNKSLPFRHQHCADIIIACATLHNYIITKCIPIDQGLTYTVPTYRSLPNALNEDNTVEGRQNREFIRVHMFGRPSMSAETE